ncbi:MAG: hypothetical protein ACRDRU_23700 [Pseudonocardiaceae bacterium]
MIKSEHVKSDRPELDRTEDPRGGAVVWALLVVAVAVAMALGRHPAGNPLACPTGP